MIVLAIFLSVIFSVGINGMADNLPSEFVPFANISQWMLPRCAYCGAIRKPSDWMVLIAFLLRRGSCARCGAPRPARDAVVETGMIIAMLLLVCFWPVSLLGVLFEGLLLSLFLLITIIDFEHRAVLLEVIVVGGIVLLLGGMRNGFQWVAPMLAGSAAGVGIALLLFLFGKLVVHLVRWDVEGDPLGFGDVMIAGLVGLVTGWPGIMMAMFLAVFMGGIAGVGILFIQWLRHRASAGTTMAYGPYLALSALVMHYSGTQLAGWFVQ
jgi:leader peptidase (prepilin peptidase) / N-methyltransferase